MTKKTAAKVHGLKTMPVIMILTPINAVIALTARLFMVEIDFFLNDFEGTHYGIRVDSDLDIPKFISMVLPIENDRL